MKLKVVSEFCVLIRESGEHGGIYLEKGRGISYIPCICLACYVYRVAP
jgi:hypothetical protein